jgi:hypothetical protein
MGNTVVQTTYRPQIAYGLEGMISEETDSEVGTRICETAAGITFGKAVSQGAGAKGCIIGGANFVGVSVRDITLGLVSPVPLGGVGDNPLDTYGQYTNVAVLSRGRIWVKPQGLIAPNDAVFYDVGSGRFGNNSGGLAASGSVTFSRQPANNETLVINGATLTFVTGTPTGDQAAIGATLGDTVANAAAVMDGSATAGFAALTFRAEPPTPGGGGSGSDTIFIVANAVGVAGNALAITSGPAGMTKSGATLAGGTAAGTAIVGAKWLDAAVAGQTARITLGIQQ